MASRAEWSRRVLSWKASGLTAAEFAASRGWSPATLRWWASRLNRQAPATIAVPFARLVATSPTVGDSTDREPPPIVVELRQARVLLPGGFDRDDFAAVIGLLGGSR